jgi:hypothetical protein
MYARFVVPDDRLVAEATWRGTGGWLETLHPQSRTARQQPITKSHSLVTFIFDLLQLK